MSYVSIITCGSIFSVCANSHSLIERNVYYWLFRSREYLIKLD